MSCASASPSSARSPDLPARNCTQPRSAPPEVPQRCSKLARNADTFPPSSSSRWTLNAPNPVAHVRCSDTTSSTATRAPGSGADSAPGYEIVRNASPSALDEKVQIHVLLSTPVGANATRNVWGAPAGVGVTIHRPSSSARVPESGEYSGSASANAIDASTRSQRSMGPGSGPPGSGLRTASPPSRASPGTSLSPNESQPADAQPTPRTRRHASANRRIPDIARSLPLPCSPPLGRAEFHGNSARDRRVGTCRT